VSARAERRASCSGVTLLELLVAVAILATLSGVLYGTFSRALAARAYAVASGDRFTRARAAIDWLEGDLAGSFSAGLYPSGAKRFLSAGRADEPTLGATALLDVTTSSARGTVSLVGPDIEIGEELPRPSGDQIRVLYHLEPAPEQGQRAGMRGYDLVRYEHRPPADSELEEATRAVIAYGIASIEMRFSDGTTWFEQWDSAGAGGAQRGAAPALVELRVRLADAEDPLELVSAVRVVLGGRHG
jgi:prepilin-type N-terminal cleavage/methylation domain-containing protein